MKGLVLHAGAHAATREQVEVVKTPEPVGIWYPIPHLTVRNLVAEQVTRNGLQIVEEAYGLWKDGARAFGLMGLRNGDPNEEYQLVLGWRNSHDKSFPAAGALGSHVFVCDNLAFSGEVTFARKHTLNVMRDLPGLVVEAVGRLLNARDLQETRINAYKAYALTNERVHDILIQSLDTRIIGPVKLPHVLEQWRNPQYADFKPRTVWSLMNAYTEVLKGLNLSELPRRTVRLHGLLDQVVGIEAKVGQIGDDIRAKDDEPDVEIVE